MKKVFVIAGKESGYIHRLYEYILSCYSQDFEIVLFTDEEALGKYLKNIHAEILVCEEGFRIKDKENVETFIGLSETPGVHGMVYKYTACDSIMKNIMAICATEKPADPVKKSASKALIGVYTPIKRCFQTTFAITLGQILAKSHRVLYLNFESFSGFEILRNRQGGTDLWDLVYFSECEEGNFNYRINSIKEKIGELDYISPVKLFTRYEEVSAKKWERLLNNLLTATDYEYIILDLSECVNGLLNILRKCTKIYTITDPGHIASAKVAQYENLLRTYAYDEVLERTETITIPTFKEIPREFELLTKSELACYIRKMLDSSEGASYG